MKKLFTLFSAFSLLLTTVSTAHAQGPLCQELFSSPPSSASAFELNNFHQALAMLNLYTGSKLPPLILDQMQVFESLRKADLPVDVLALFNIQKYSDAAGGVKIRWSEVDFENPEKASAAMVKMARLLALEHFYLVRKEKGFARKIWDTKRDTLERIEIELYLKILLQAEGHLEKASEFSTWLPWNLLKVGDVQLDQKLIDIYNTQGKEAFQAAVAKRYGWKIGVDIGRSVSMHAMHLAGIISVILIYYFYQQGEDYFEKMMKMESGLKGNDYDLFTRLVKDSGLKSPQDILKWLDANKTHDPDMDEFNRELHAELKK